MNLTPSRCRGAGRRSGKADAWFVPEKTGWVQALDERIARRSRRHCP